ncbi:MAG: DNA repair protein RadC [Alphaproteobacteria bacterium]|nr:DNA repair protein RadC [Alphaproteobacteria bacterium]
MRPEQLQNAADHSQDGGSSQYEFNEERRSFAEASPAFEGRPRGNAPPRPFAPPEAYGGESLVTEPRNPASRQPFPNTGPHGHRQRMRDKLVERGADALADYELLEMLLYPAQRMGDTKPLAKKLINHYGDFARVLATPAEELAGMPDLGVNHAAAIKLVQAAALRMMQAEVREHPVLNNMERLMGYLTAALSREKNEQFRVLFLDSKNRLITDEAQSRGTVNHTPVYPREVVKRALELHATALILVHNHPSGDPTPSRADIEMTAAIRDAARTLDIVLHDHLILGNGTWTSFRREGLLDR